MSEIIKLGEGKYAIRWRTAEGKRKYETVEAGTPHKKVKEILADRIACRNAERRCEATVAQLADDYLETRGKKLSASGFVRARGVVDELKMDPIGAVIAAELKSWHFDDWQDRLEEAGNSDGTIDRKANVLRAIIRSAVRRGRLATSPLRLGDLQRRVPSNKTTPIFFTTEEWSAFIGAIDDDAQWNAYVAGKHKAKVVTFESGRAAGFARRPDSDATAAWRSHLLEWQPVWWTLLLTGCRLREILDLRWEQVDLRNGVILIEQTKTDVPKPAYIGEELREFLEALPRGVGKAYVFATSDGTAHTNMEAQRAFATYRAVAGLRRVLTIHKLRHTTASWMVQSGANLKAVQAALGHRSINTTMKYAHLAPEHVMAAMAPVGKMARGEK